MRNRRKVVNFVAQNALVCWIVLSVFVGFSAGISLRGVHLPTLVVDLIEFPGEIFIQSLKMMILPLIFSSLTSSLAQMNGRDAKRMGLYTILYYLFTAVLAAALGLILVYLIHPGDPAYKNYRQPFERQKVSPADTIFDLIRNIFPENVVRATIQNHHTTYIKVEENGTFHMEKEVVFREGTNVLGVVLFCTCLGLALSKIGERAKPVVDMFVVLEEAVMWIVNVFMWFAPLGISCLICGNLLRVENLSEVFTILLKYVGTVLLGVILHSFVTLPTLYYVITRRNPMDIIEGMAEPVLATLGTSSGGAILPIAVQCAEIKCDIDRRIAGFVLPLASTINMDGSALYEAVAVIFIAQLNNVSLGVIEICTISATATLASLGLNNVPAGLVSILLILKTVGLPADDVALLLTVDWLLDRVRSALNVLGDGFAAGIIANLITFKRDVLLCTV